MNDHSSSAIDQEIWTGVFTLLPVVVIYLRSVIAELGKVSAQCVWNVIKKKRQRSPTAPTVVIVVLCGSDCPCAGIGRDRPL
jgi:hypothetical protein